MRTTQTIMYLVVRMAGLVQDVQTVHRRVAYFWRGTRRNPDWTPRIHSAFRRSPAGSGCNHRRYWASDHGLVVGSRRWPAHHAENNRKRLQRKSNSVHIWIPLTIKSFFSIRLKLNWFHILFYIKLVKLSRNVYVFIPFFIRSMGTELILPVRRRMWQPR